MRIGAVGFSPYVYNTNAVSSLSLGKISAIPNNVTERKLDYSGLLSDDKRNVNPLGRGQSANFMDILASQMSMSRYQQVRIMKDAVSPSEDTASSVKEETVQTKEPVLNVAGINESQDAGQQAMENGFSRYRMNQALQAYTMNYAMGIF